MSATSTNVFFANLLSYRSGKFCPRVPLASSAASLSYTIAFIVKLRSFKDVSWIKAWRGVANMASVVWRTITVDQFERDPVARNLPTINLQVSILPVALSERPNHAGIWQRTYSKLFAEPLQSRFAVNQLVVAIDKAFGDATLQPSAWAIFLGEWRWFAATALAQLDGILVGHRLLLNSSGVGGSAASISGPPFLF